MGDKIVQSKPSMHRDRGKRMLKELAECCRKFAKGADDEAIPGRWRPNMGNLKAMEVEPDLLPTQRIHGRRSLIRKVRMGGLGVKSQ